MLTVSLDVHAGASQLVVVKESGEAILEMKVPTTAEALANVIGGIEGPKRVVFEQGPLSSLIHDALDGMCDEVICADPTHNALIARAEDSNDARDARRLATLTQVKSVRPVYIAPEPYRSLRAMQAYNHRLIDAITAAKNRIAAVYRSQGVRYRGKAPYRASNREALCAQIVAPGPRWQIESLYRQLDTLRREHRESFRELGRMVKRLPVIRRLDGIPGVGKVTALTLTAWLAGPERFKSPQALVSYGGLGLGQGYTNWKPTGRARASKRGNREVKRVLFLAAKAAARTDSALGQRARARAAAGWDVSKIRRDLARTILKIAAALWKNNTDYDDRRVRIPPAPSE